MSSNFFTGKKLPTRNFLSSALRMIQAGRFGSVALKPKKSRAVVHAELDQYSEIFQLPARSCSNARAVNKTKLQKPAKDVLQALNLRVARTACGPRAEVVLEHPRHSVNRLAHIK